MTYKHLLLQGEWKPKQVDNPDYKGSWVHPEIDNPEYSADSSIYKFDNVGVLGLDLWQVRKRSSLNSPVIVAVIFITSLTCFTFHFR